MRIASALLFLVVGTSSVTASASEKPNVILISIDDLNDWVGCLEGHPQASTPNIDRLAKRGVLFQNAHCQAPVCQPSRASLMVSRLPSSTGLYFLNPGLQHSAVTKDEQTLPEAFAAAGYKVMGAGKLFHSKDNQRVFGSVGEYGGSFGGFGPRPQKKISQPHGHPLWDWGAFPEKTEEMPDYKIASWAQQTLNRDYEKPFFLAVGFYRPHVPMYAPKKWFELHPRDQVRLPLLREGDIDDLSAYARNLVTLKHVAPEHGWMKESGQWPHAVQSYLASVSFADHCVGMILEALEQRRDADNTIICLFADHGFHLGEKERWAKRSLWEDGTRVPLIIAGPSIETAVCHRPVGLIDIFPTLLDLTGQQADPKHEGHSLTPLLENPAREWEHPALTSFGRGNHAVRSTRWRYIRYVDGSEELYDHDTDPHEWTNLASDPKLKSVISEHRRWLPTSEQPILGKDSTGHKAYAAAAAELE
jgi:arylsulfatase A-like enzyme